MDDDAFKLLTSFIVKGRKLTGPIDSDMLLEDAAYALEIFRKIEEEGDEDQVMLSLKPREQFGLLPALPGSDGEDKDGDVKVAGKYTFGARS